MFEQLTELFFDGLLLVGFAAVSLFVLGFGKKVIDVVMTLFE